MNERIILFLAIALTFLSCNEVDNESEFNISLIPGVYSGSLNLTGIDDSTGWEVPGYWITPYPEYQTVVKSKNGSFTFCFDENCELQIQDIEFHVGEFYGFAANIRVSISYIESNEYVLGADRGHIGRPDAWKFYNFFQKDALDNNIYFELSLESLPPDTLYRLKFVCYKYLYI